MDYLQTRADIDSKKLAYFGVSWGGYMGGIMPAIEPLIKKHQAADCIRYQLPARGSPL